MVVISAVGFSFLHLDVVVNTTFVFGVGSFMAVIGALRYRLIPPQRDQGFAYTLVEKSFLIGLIDVTGITIAIATSGGAHST